MEQLESKEWLFDHKQNRSRCILRSKNVLKRKFTGVQETQKIEVLPYDAQEAPQDSAGDHAIEKDKEIEQKIKKSNKVNNDSCHHAHLRFFIFFGVKIIDA